jgi:UDP-N-acetylmuramate--alanine ligase
MASDRLGDVERVHLVGIGGSGMSALASLLLAMGKTVSGSELAPGSTTASLEAAGAHLVIGHAAEHVGNAQYVVRSSAVPESNPELGEAQRRGLPVRKLADAVGELTEGRSTVAVAGTHGKTTTTALVAWLLERGGLDPLVLIGGDTPAFPGGAKLGNGPIVIEADEYDRRFLSYWPEVAVVTGVEPDHLDYYRDLAEIKEAFAHLIQRLPEHGALVVCADDPIAPRFATSARRETYGFDRAAEWQIDNFVSDGERGAHFTVQHDGRAWEVESPLVGEHNARNATAAIVVADYFGVGLRASLAAARSFQAPRRRFQSRGHPDGVWLVDDYGHHPTEVAAVLRAASEAAAGDVWIVFQPHTTNRTAALLDEFAASFDDAQHALVLPIYRPSGRELDPRPIQAEDLVRLLTIRGHPHARLVETFEAAQAAVLEGAQSGDLVITMGAGDVTLLADRLVAALSERAITSGPRAG